MSPQDTGLVLAPADGKILEITKLDDMATGPPGGPSDHDRHRPCRRAAPAKPVAGRIVDNFLTPGLFRAADNLALARRDNERREISIETEDGARIMLVQIGTATARQLVSPLFARQISGGRRAARHGACRRYFRPDRPVRIRGVSTAGMSVLAGETVIAKTDRLITMFDARIEAGGRQDPRSCRTAARAPGVDANKVTFAGFLLRDRCGRCGGASGGTPRPSLLLLNRLLDGLDGAVARAAGGTDLGGFLDITMDFLVYSAIPLRLRAWVRAMLLAAAFSDFQFRRHRVGASSPMRLSPRSAAFRPRRGKRFLPSRRLDRGHRDHHFIHCS